MIIWWHGKHNDIALVNENKYQRLAEPDIPVINKSSKLLCLSARLFNFTKEIKFQMESNINYKVISDYSRGFSDKVAEKAFAQNDRITGTEIRSLTDIKQVNYFVMMNLFRKWKEEVNKIKSPYFDYQSEDVQQAIERLMNALSQNILVSKEDFKPILEKSVQQSLLLIFSPYDFFKNEFFSQPWTINELKDSAKFVRINDFLLKTVIEEATKKNFDVVDQVKASRILDGAMKETHQTPEEIDNYVQQLSVIKPLNVAQLYIEKETPAAKDKEIPSPRQSDFVTLNDQFLKEPTPSLADLHLKVKIENIKNYITINQRFMFINDLFNSNAAEFNAAVDELENKRTFEEALAFLKKNYGDKYGWDMDSETLVEFLDVVSKRY
jgi:hypothetical protein